MLTWIEDIVYPKLPPFVAMRRKLSTNAVSVVYRLQQNKKHRHEWQIFINDVRQHPCKMFDADSAVEWCERDNGIRQKKGTINRGTRTAARNAENA